VNIQNEAICWKELSLLKIMLVDIVPFILRQNFLLDIQNDVDLLRDIVKSYIC
jgi:hypothetical protein